jgi:hypothetical protein
MFYRIMKPPPGYASDQQFMVASYESLDLNSKQDNLTAQNGSIFAATIEGARGMIPLGAKRMPFEPDRQFLELWSLEAAEADAE